MRHLAAAVALLGVSSAVAVADVPLLVSAASRASLDGSTYIAAANTAVTLFGGAVPQNGFMVEGYVGGACYVNDNGPATTSNGAAIVGFLLCSNGVQFFVTPPGYKPMGPVTIACEAAGQIEARSW